MAEQQPAATPAATDGTATPSQQPGATPAGDQAANTISFESFSDDAKKYLAGQGVTSQETLTSDAINKLVNHAQSSQKTAAERQAELDRIKNGGGTPPANTDGTTPPATPSATTPGATPETAAAAAAPKVDETQMFLLGATLVQSFPELKDDLTSGKLYKDMETFGIPVAVNGQANLNGILAYAKNAQALAQANAKIEELSQPGRVPSAEAQLPKQPESNAPMTKQLARAIALNDPTNARSAEAAKFLQDNA